MSRHLLTVDDLERNPWAHCGPAALAACLGIRLEDARAAFPDRSWISVGDMRRALASISPWFYFTAEDFAAPVVAPSGRPVTWPHAGLVLVQFCGSWSTLPLQHAAQLERTHWIAVSPCPVASPTVRASVAGVGYKGSWVFDVNTVDTGPLGGWRPRETWEQETVPRIVASYGKKRDGTPRASGAWWSRCGIEVEVRSR